MCKAISSETETVFIKDRRLKQHLPFDSSSIFSCWFNWNTAKKKKKAVNKGSIF